MESKERPLVYVTVDGFQGLPEFTIRKTSLVLLSGQGSRGREDIVSLLSGLLSFLGDIRISERSYLFREVFIRSWVHLAWHFLGELPAILESWGTRGT